MLMMNGDDAAERARQRDLVRAACGGACPTSSTAN